MSDKAGTPAAENAAGASTAQAAGNASSGSAPNAAPKKAQNPAFRMMGLPRLRLPSRNWLIFLSITGGIASAIYYDKYQTRRNRQKWCDLVSHFPDETLPANRLPRRMTVYLCAPPGDGLRSAREHFHAYVKPVLVAAAMDWDVVEGRKEGDIRFKTAERIRRKRKKAGEGEVMSQEEWDKLNLIDDIRKRSGTEMYDGVAGDLVIGRHTWKEYIRGLHEGWLGPPDAPKQPDTASPEGEPTSHTDGIPSLGDAAVKAAASQLAPAAELSPASDQDASPTADTPPAPEKEKTEKEKKKEEENKPRQPPPYIQPTEYTSATVSPQIPDIIGPSIGIRQPHILGFRNTPIRIYRFFTRRRLADAIGKDVATAVMASYRPYEYSASSGDDENTSSDKPEQAKVLQREERDWWKTTYQPRKEHEESVWIEDIVLDERIAGRMRAFQLMAEDEDRAKRLGEGNEKVVRKADLVADDAEG